ATGAVNFSDPLIAAIVKPTVFRGIDSTDTGVTLTAGAQWDSNNNNFFSDNQGAQQIGTPGHTSRTLMHFDVQNSFTLHPYDGAYAASTGIGSSTLAFVT